MQKSAAHKVISILTVFSQRLGGFFHGGRFDEDFGFVIAGEKRFHFLPESLVAGAGFLEEGDPLCGIALQD